MALSPAFLVQLKDAIITADLTEAETDQVNALVDIISPDYDYRIGAMRAIERYLFSRGWGYESAVEVRAPAQLALLNARSYVSPTPPEGFRSTFPRDPAPILGAFVLQLEADVTGTSPFRPAVEINPLVRRTCAEAAIIAVQGGMTLATALRNGGRHETADELARIDAEIARYDRDNTLTAVLMREARATTGLWR